MVIEIGCGLQDLAAAIHGHPTLAEIMLEVSSKALDKSLRG